MYEWKLHSQVLSETVTSPSDDLKVISKFSNIVTFFEDLMRVVSSLRMERDHKVIVVFQKVMVRITTYYLLKRKDMHEWKLHSQVLSETVTSPSDDLVEMATVFL
jgi:hypothetical protein